MKHKNHLKIIGGIIIISLVIFLSISSNKGNNSNTNSPSYSHNNSLSQDNTNTNKSQNTIFKRSHKIGDTITYNGMSIRVNSVKFWNGDEDNQPDNGKQFVIPNVTLKNNNKSTQGFGDFELDDNGSRDLMDNGLYSGPYSGKYISNGDFDPGSTRTGLLSNEVKSGDKYQLIYEPEHRNNDDQVIRINLN